MSESKVQHWNCLFREESTNIRISTMTNSGWPSVVTDDLVGKVNAKFHENQNSRFLSLKLHFLKFHILLFMNIFAVRNCTRLIHKMFTNVHKHVEAGFKNDGDEWT